ncbi:MAG: ABC transporter permease, partial [Lachnospiraceae bacterium]|nr:ABC transporter permease [Lachnospiraceae bacterium]
MLLVILWEAATWNGMIDSFIYSSPSRIVKCFVDMFKDGNIIRHILVTLFETGVSFTLVNGVGILVAVILWCKLSVAKITEPYLVVLNSLPKSALAPLLIVWLGNSMKTIIVAAISVAVFGTIISI